MKKLLLTTGKRKRAIARAKAVQGTGKITINGINLDNYPNKIAKLMIKEPLVLSEDTYKKLDISVNVKGGGMFGQAEAIRQAIAKMLVQYNKKLKQVFLDYDRTLLVADVRRTEPHKPSRSKKGPRRRKQRSKR
ncbi:MAG: 30S ribosomal protein S9 [Candidatus Aenigmarchaeota archaeon]|nr:30S ribosomal protein S9 [Candidatus Aenigmarchaeota archaeon]